MNFAARLGVAFVLLTSLAGCVGYVGGPGDGGAVILAPVPVYGYWGGWGEWGGREEGGYGRRGFESRGGRR